MAISLKTHKMVWGRSGNMCAFPNCKRILVVDETSTDDPSVIGEEAHIVAQKPDGPRGTALLSMEQRDKYDNLILLCSVHHKIIDDQEKEYTIEKLHHFKKEHESWVKNNLVVDHKKIKDDELYATYIEKFVELTDLHNWNNWTSWPLGASEIFPKQQFESLRKVPDYIISRIWPNRYQKLEMAFVNFKNIVNDLMRVYYLYPKERNDGYAIERFYKDFNETRCWMNGQEYSLEEENIAVKKYQYHVSLVDDLVVELTRAANYICDYIREYIYEGFRIEEGALLITLSDFFSSKTYRVEYRNLERIDFPYPGLKEFMKMREERDFQFGEGIDESYFSSMPWEL